LFIATSNQNFAHVFSQAQLDRNQRTSVLLSSRKNPAGNHQTYQPFHQQFSKVKELVTRNLTLKSSVLSRNPLVSCLKIFQNLELEVATKSKNCPTLPKLLRYTRLKELCVPFCCFLYQFFKKWAKAKSLLPLASTHGMEYSYT
jgi:hypothetical protein